MRLLIFTLLTACGTAPQQGSPADASSATAKTSVPATTTKQTHDLLVADMASLPPCTVNDEGWLIYIKSKAIFELCTGGAWETASISVKGDKGDPGVNGVSATGTAGAQGATGATGAAGAPGAAGTNGAQGAMGPGPLQFWIDPTTKKVWESSLQVMPWSDVAYMCPPNFTMPDAATLQNAWADGLNVFLSIYIKNGTNMWNGTNAAHQTNDFAAGTGVVAAGQVALAVCVHL